MAVGGWPPCRKQPQPQHNGPLSRPPRPGRLSPASSPTSQCVPKCGAGFCHPPVSLLLSPPHPPAYFACCTPSCSHGYTHTHQVTSQNLCLALVSPSILHSVQLPPTRQDDVGLACCGVAHADHSGRGCSSWLCSSPCPHTLEGRECCPPDLCRQGSRPPSVPAAGDSAGPRVRSDRT